MRNMPEITGLRGMAALYVAAFHAVMIFGIVVPAAHHPLARGFLNYGWIGVDLFFVLSGFLLAGPLLAAPPRLASGPFWRTWLTKRTLRIAPPYYASILLGTLLVGTFAWFRVDAWNLFLHLTYLHGFTMGSFITLHPVAWTLALEFQFYLLLPLAARAFGGRRWPWALAASALVALVWRAWTFVPGDVWTSLWLSHQLPGFAFHFGLGIALARFRHGATGGRGTHWSLPVVALLALAVPLALWFAPNGLFGSESRLAQTLLRPLLALGFGLIIWHVTAPGSPWGRLLGARALQHAGATSYSLYLVHLAIGAWLVLTVPAVAGWPFAVFVAVYMVLAYAGAAAFHHVVERPTLGLKARLGRRMEGDAGVRATGAAPDDTTIAPGATEADRPVPT